MTFKDIFKKSFLAVASTGDLSMKRILLTFVITSVFAAYIFVVYRIITRKTFYNKNFNISLAANTVIVAAVIMAIQSNIVVSLGMVGALSIVRYRTAVKDPMDLTFLFWSISIGIICGARLPGLAIAASAVLTVGILVLDAVPVAKAPMLLIVSADSKGVKAQIMDAITKNAKYFKVKSQTMETDRLDMIVEVRSQNCDSLLDSISAIPNVKRCSLVSHDGEVTF